MPVAQTVATALAEAAVAEAGHPSILATGATVELTAEAEEQAEITEMGEEAELMAAEVVLGPLVERPPVQAAHTEETAELEPPVVTGKFFLTRFPHFIPIL